MKKAQIQMQETILVIFIFIIIVGIGLIVFNKFNQQSINKIGEDDQLSYFYNLAGNFNNLPELKCSSLGSEKECVDVSKLMALKQNANFLFSNITIYTVYPEKSNRECTLSVLQQGLDCGTFLIYNNIPGKCKKETCQKKVIFSPVSLYYPDRDVYELGKLVIEVYL